MQHQVVEARPLQVMPLLLRQQLQPCLVAVVVVVRVVVVRVMALVRAVLVVVLVVVVLVVQVELEVEVVAMVVVLVVILVVVLVVEAVEYRQVVARQDLVQIVKMMVEEVMQVLAAKVLAATPTLMENQVETHCRHRQV